MAGPGAQRKLHDFVAEVFWVCDAGGLFDLREFLIQKLAIEQLAGVRILEVLVLDPGVRVIDITVEQVLPVIVIALEICLLDFMADEFRIARRQFGLDEF